MRDFSPPTAPPSRTAHSTSFLLLLRPLSLLAQSVPFILHSSFAAAAPAAAAAGRSPSLSLSFSFFPALLLLRHAGLFSSLFVPWWRTFATYAADTPLDTSCTILDLLISRPECTDAHRDALWCSAPPRVCACTHAIHKGLVTVPRNDFQ